MRNFIRNTILILIGALSVGFVYAAPTYRLERSIMPETTNTYELGTSTKQWLRGTFSNICLSGDCQSSWPAGFSSTSADYWIENYYNTPTKNYALLWNGTAPVWAPQGTSFTFSVNTFTCSFGSSQNVLIGSGTWKNVGDLSFSATYNNGPATNGYVSHTGWTNLTMGGVGYIGPTTNDQAVTYPASVAGTKVFTLNATDGTDTNTKSVTYTFINYRFWGTTTKTSGYTEADVEGLTGSELSNSGSKTFTSTTGSGEYILWASRTGIGARTFTVDGFSGGFQAPETVSITNSAGFTETYYVYRSTNSNLGSISVVVN